ncbi:hypothetical protein [Candidatus Harpocratesius sp.]
MKRKRKRTQTRTQTQTQTQTKTRTQTQTQTKTKTRTQTQTQTKTRTQTQTQTKTQTKTQSFGVSKREGHDATQFYSSRLYEGIPQEKNKCKIVDNSDKINIELFNKIYEIDHLFNRILEESLHLIILKIPIYKIGKRENFVNTISSWASRLRNLLINGGRLVVIIQNRNKDTFFPLHSFIVPNIIREEFLLRGDVILTYEEILSDKDDIANIYDHGFVFSKNIYGRKKKDKKAGLEKTDTIERDDFIQFTKSIWKSNLPSKNITAYLSRFLELYSFKEDSILIISDEKLEEMGTILRKIRNNIILGRI